MSKFNIGDKVKVVKEVIGSDKKHMQKTFTVQGTDEEGVHLAELPTCNYMWDYQLELVEKDNGIQELRGQLELLRFQYEQLKKVKVREKTLSEASYEELAKEMWKRCAEV